jgi:hypothetical protein
MGHQSLEVIDRDEARFAQASKQMVLSGDLITPYFMDELRAKKPIGIYWLQSASAAIFGHFDIARRAGRAFPHLPFGCQHVARNPASANPIGAVACRYASDDRRGASCQDGCGIIGGNFMSAILSLAALSALP